MTNQPQPLLPFNAFDHQALQKVQATNLRWCEEWGATLPAIAGVQIGRALVFDLIQLINRSEIEYILGPTPDFITLTEEARQRVEGKTKPPMVAIEKGNRRRLRKPKIIEVSN